jgi:DNA replication protein DnaC
MLKRLRLSAMARTLDVRIQEARSNRLDPEEFMELVLQDELNIRNERLIGRRIKAAAFAETKTLEDFDWSFNPSIRRRQIYDLAAGHYIERGQDILFLGPPGVGKSFLAQALGHEAIRQGRRVLYRSIFDVVREFLREESSVLEERVLPRYLKADLLIIDDMGMKQLPPRSGEYLFEVVMRRHRNRSTMMTSNRPIEDWGKLLADVPSATAILDRFLESAVLIEIKGRSYRMKQRAEVQS